MGNPRNQSYIPERISPPAPSPAQQKAARLGSGRVVIVCGAADYRDRDRVFAALDLAHGRQRITLLVHGATGAETGELRGVDRWADEWAAERGVDVEPHGTMPSTWGKAVAMRNHQMADAGAHGCIAFPGDRCSEQMVRQAEFYGIPVWKPFG
jgi:hypothetical protein